MLDSSDPDVFNDRQFFVEFMYADLKAPIYPSIEDIFRRIKHTHQEMVEPLLRTSSSRHMMNFAGKRLLPLYFLLIL